MKTSIKYSNKELVESHFIPEVNIKKSDKKVAEKFLADLIFQRKGKQTQEEKIKYKILQLRFRIEDFISSKTSEKDYTFGSFLKEYAIAVNLKSYELAIELEFNKTQLSQIINTKVDPPNYLLIRLGLHSNNAIDSRLWYQLYSKQKEVEFVQILKEKKLMDEQSKHVKRKLAVSI